MAMDLVCGPPTVEATQQAALLVVGDQRRRLAMVDLESTPDRLFAVIVALDESGAVLIAHPLMLWRVELDVVDVGRVLDADPAPGEPAYDLIVVDVDHEHRAETPALSLERPVKRVRLALVAGKAVEEEPFAGVWLINAIDDHLDDDRVGNELAAIHVPLGGEPKLASGDDLSAQHVAGGDVGEGEVCMQTLRLGALACARRAKQNEVEL